MASANDAQEQKMGSVVSIEISTYIVMLPVVIMVTIVSSFSIRSGGINGTYIHREKTQVVHQKPQNYRFELKKEGVSKQRMLCNITSLEFIYGISPCEFVCRHVCFRQQLEWVSSSRASVKNESG